MLTREISFHFRGKEYKLAVVTATALSELEALMQPKDILDACNRRLVKLAQNAALGRKERKKRFVRVDLNDPRLSKDIVSLLHTFDNSKNASSKVSGVTTRAIPPAADIAESTNS